MTKNYQKLLNIPPQEAVSPVVLHDAAAVSLPPEVPVQAVHALYTILSKGQLSISLLCSEQCSRSKGFVYYFSYLITYIHLFNHSHTILSPSPHRL